MQTSRSTRARILCCGVAFAGALGFAGAFAAPGLALAAAQPAKAVKSIDDVKSMVAPAIPANAKEIATAATAAKAGDTVAIRGYIPEAGAAMSDSISEFTLVGALPEAQAGSPRATVRIVNDQGQPIKGSLNGQHGLKPGAEVFVTGVVTAVGGESAMTVNASSLYVSRAPLPSGFFTDKPADNARDISEARKATKYKPGDEVVLRGRIGGSKQPFVAGRAVFTLVGRGLKACNENPGDKCRMPWDYCCDPKDEILANSITVQVVDAKSQVLRTDMKGRKGLKELSEVVVVGKVVSADAKSVVVNATSMHAVE